jgi:hypothetical protein
VSSGRLSEIQKAAMNINEPAYTAYSAIPPFCSNIFFIAFILRFIAGIKRHTNKSPPKTINSGGDPESMIGIK